MSKNIKKLVAAHQYALRGIFISSYIPRRCGIATYTKDLVDAINILNPQFLGEIMALDDDREPVSYPWEVKFRIRKEKETDYLHAARYINKSSADYVILQHEFGIFGGRSGEYVLNLVRNIKKPVITTFHTTLKDPSPEQVYILKKIANYSKACIVMINEAARRLKNVYDIPSEKVVVIHHGVHDIPFSPSNLFKKDIGFSEKDFLIGSINLIAPNKGLEFVVKALPKLVNKNPNVKFIMIGQTHPIVKTHFDEEYRIYLRKMVKDLGMKKYFIEINEYVSLEMLIKYLKGLDVYITPYLDMNQTSSGTLAYAIGAGKTCVSTPFIYAKEMLANNRGIFVNPRNSTAIASTISKVIANLNYRHKIEEKAYAFGRQMIWERVALDYLNIIKYVTQ